MNFIRHLCKDTFDNCLVMFHKKPSTQNSHEYSNVSHEMSEDVFHNEEEEEDYDAFAAWPSQKNDSTKASSINSAKNSSENAKELATTKTQSTESDSPSAKKPMLIGNIDEENISKKKEIVNDKDDELFAQMNMTLTPNIAINKVKSDSKKSDKSKDEADRLQKFKMDEDLEPAEGWIDENDIQI
mmetsp:Transcript_29447/g.34037  ORF Transcript_29447/g.34037 Transcript_29447/m.34037 type:complete len:185 (+) Transcript_29447:75-629(+)